MLFLPFGNSSEGFDRENNGKTGAKREESGVGGLKCFSPAGGKKIVEADGFLFAKKML